MCSQESRLSLFWNRLSTDNLTVCHNRFIVDLYETITKTHSVFLFLAPSSHEAWFLYVILFIQYK